MSLLKKFMCLCTAFILFFLSNGCILDNDSVNYEEYKEDSLVEISINDANESYYFICTDDYQIVTHDNITGKTKIAKCEEGTKSFIKSCLTSISEDDNNIEYGIGINDFYIVGLYIDDKDYYFTYGLSSNPYANMLVEIIIGSCDYKPAQEALVPFPSTFR